MKKIFLALLIAGSLAACDDNKTTDSTTTVGDKKDSIENKTDSMQDKIQANADTAKDRLERKSDSLKNKVEQKADMKDSANKMRK